VSGSRGDRELGPRLIEAFDPLAAFLVAEIDRGATPGAAWWVGDTGGAIATGAIGHATIEPDRVPLTVDLPFDLASLTKPLATALLATILARERRLNFETRIGAVIPELRTSPFGEATLADAAAHRAGFPAWAALYLAGTSRQAYLNAIAASDRKGAPGETLYSDLGYLVLGFALERAVGAPLDRLFDERVAGPLGLLRCGFAAQTGRFSDAAATERGNAYERELAGPAVDANRFRREIPRGQVNDGNAWGLGGIAGNAGLFGAVADVASIALAILDPPRIGLPADALEAMLRPASEGAGARTVGFLRAVDAEAVRGVLPDDAVGHLGFTGTSVWIDAKRQRVYVLLTNRIHPRVPREPFTATRQGFHRIAAGL
jgi:CubicO group peptidase (beta-lactamase class C family)